LSKGSALIALSAWSLVEIIVCSTGPMAEMSGGERSGAPALGGCDRAGREVRPGPIAGRWPVCARRD